MSKILLNGKQACIHDLVSALTTDDGEFDFDALGAAMDSDTLKATMDSFEGGSFNIPELIDRYLSLADLLEVKT